jgi:hypothetical protein
MLLVRPILQRRSGGEPVRVIFRSLRSLQAKLGNSLAKNADRKFLPLGTFLNWLHRSCQAVWLAIPAVEYRLSRHFRPLRQLPRRTA